MLEGIPYIEWLLKNSLTDMCLCKLTTTRCSAIKNFIVYIYLFLVLAKNLEVLEVITPVITRLARVFVGVPLDA